MALQDWVGIPYGFDRDPEKSLDCWNLCRLYAGAELGIHYPEFPYDITDEEAYIAAGKLHIETQKLLQKSWRKQEIMQPGDILLMRMRGNPSHVAIYVGLIEGKASFLHTLRGRNSSLEFFTFWGQQIEAAYRYIPNANHDPAMPLASARAAS